VTASIEVFGRPIEVEYFVPASGSQEDVISVAVLHVPEDAGEPTCEITTSSNGAYAATVFQSETQPGKGKSKFQATLLQIEVPSNLELEDSEVLHVSLDYGDGASVQFSWNFVPATVPSVFLITPSSQYTYGGGNVRIALTNTDFDMNDPPVVSFGGELAPPFKIERRDDLTIIVVRAPGLSEGCEGAVTIDYVIYTESCTVSGTVTHSTYASDVTFTYEYTVPETPTVVSLTQYIGSSFGGDYVAAELQNFPAVADDEADLVVINFDGTFVTASGIRNKKDGSLGVSFTTPPYSGGAGISTVQFSHAGVPKLSAIVEFEYYDAAEVRLLGDPSPSIGDSLGGTECQMSFENFAVLTELELALDPNDIYGFQCEEEFGRVASIIKSMNKKMSVNVVVPAGPTGLTTCYFFRKDDADKRAAVNFEFEDAALPNLNSVKPKRAVATGGNVVRLDVGRFPLLSSGTDSIGEVLVLFGGVEADVSEVLKATSTSTVFLVVVPEAIDVVAGGDVRVECSVALRAASNIRVDFDFTYTSPPLPEITYVSLEDVSASGGEEIDVRVKNLVEVQNDDGEFSNGVTVLFGFVEARVSVVKWTEKSTALKVVVPVLSESGDVEMVVYANQEGIETSAKADLFVYADEPTLQLSFPGSGGASGSAVTVVLGNIKEPLTTDDVAAAIAVGANDEGATVSEVCTVQIVSEGEAGEVTLHVVIPTVPGDAGQTSISITVGNFEVVVPWEVVDDSQPYIFSTFPPNGPTTGHQIVNVEIRNWAGLAQLFEEDAEGIAVAFGQLEALAVRHVSEEALENGQVNTLVSVLAPPFSAFGTVDMTVSLKAGTENDPVLATEFEYYTTCDFDTFCSSLDKIVNQRHLVSKPPSQRLNKRGDALDAVCSPKYCVDPPPPPFSTGLSTSTAFDVGGDRMEVVLEEWQQSDLSLVSIKLVVGESTSTFSLVSLEKRGTTGVAIKFITTAAAVGTGVLTLTDTDSGTSLVLGEVEVFAYPQDAPVLEVISPSSGSSEEDTPVFIELSNCPQSKPSDVEVRFGNIRLESSSFTSTPEATSFKVVIPSRECTEDCSDDIFAVQVVITDRFDVPRTATFEFTSVVPVPAIRRVFPREGVSTETVRVTVVLDNFKVVTSGADVRRVDSEDDVYVVWDGDTANPIYAIAESGIAQGRKFSFAFLAPAAAVTSSEAVEVEATVYSSGDVNDSQPFTYTYLPASPRLRSVVPLEISTTRTPIATEVKFIGQFSPTRDCL
jgi:hypothetical protein